MTKGRPGAAANSEARRRRGLGPTPITILIAHKKGRANKFIPAKLFYVPKHRVHGETPLVEWEMQPRQNHFLGDEAVETFTVQIPMTSDEHLGAELEQIDHVVKWLKAVRPCVINSDAGSWQLLVLLTGLSSLNNMIGPAGPHPLGPLREPIQSFESVTWGSGSTASAPPRASPIEPVALKEGDASCSARLPACQGLLDHERAGLISFAHRPQLSTEGNLKAARNPREMKNRQKVPDSEIRRSFDEIPSAASRRGSAAQSRQSSGNELRKTDITPTIPEFPADTYSCTIPPCKYTRATRTGSYEHD